MAQIAQIQAKAEIQSTPEKFFHFLKYKTTQLPTIVPHVMKSSELVEGEEGQVGNVKLLVYELGLTMNVKIKTTTLDDKEKTVKYVAVGGEILNYYSHFETKVTVEKNHVVWTFSYEKANPAVPDPDNYAKLSVEITKALDAYILVN